MPLVPLRVVLDHAAENNYGVAAFNVNNMEQIQSIMEAARETDSPVIVQASRGARSYSQDNYLRHLMLAASELYPDLPIVMHQDHGNSPATCYSAIKYGFTSVMMDGSLKEDAATPASYEYNVKVTREVVLVAHSMGVSVEGEIGCLGQVGHAPATPAAGAHAHDKDLEKEPGDRDSHATGGASGGMDSSHLTDPEEAERFVAETGCDALAVAIGTSHGAYKFKHKPTGEVLKMSLIRTSSCTAARLCHRNFRISSVSSVARWKKPTACLLKKFSEASSTACERSMSTPTAAWRSPVRFERSLLKSHELSTHANI
jgi:fructose-bisphosphate aldolase class II